MIWCGRQFFPRTRVPILLHCMESEESASINVDFLEPVDFSSMFSLDPVILLIPDVATAKPCSSISEPHWHLFTLLSSWITSMESQMPWKEATQAGYGGVQVSRNGGLQQYQWGWRPCHKPGCAFLCGHGVAPPRQPLSRCCYPISSL